MKNPHSFHTFLAFVCLFFIHYSYPRERSFDSTSKLYLATASVNSFSPASGYAGTVITVIGSDFSATSVVKIGTSVIPSTNITLISSTELQIVVPCNTTSGAIDVDGSISAGIFTYKSAVMTNLVQDQKFCVGSTVPELVLSASDPNVVFSWTNSNTATGLAPNGTGNIATFTALNSGLEPIESNIVITPSYNGCLGETKSYTVTVNPKPVLVPISDITVCEGSPINAIPLTASSPKNGSGTSFEWTSTNSSAVGLSTSNGNLSPTPSFVTKNLTNGTIFTKIDILPSFEGCVGNLSSFKISVEPESVAGTISGNATVCSGKLAGVLTLNSQVGSVVKWQSSTDGTNWNDILSTSTTYSPGVLTISTQFRAVVKSGSCSEVLTNPFLVTVSALPTVDAGLDQTICAGTSVTLAGSGASSYSWNNGVTNGSAFIPSATTTYTVTGLGSNGCSNTDQVTITVTPIPAAPSAVAQTFLSSQNATVGNLTLSSTGIPSWYNLASGGTAYNSATLLNSGTYYASQKINGCESSSRTPVLVSLFTDSVGGSVSGTTSVCSGTNSTSLTLTGHTGNVVKWQSSTVSDFSANVVDFSVQSTIISATNLTFPLYFRAVVQSGSSTSFSVPAFIDVVSPSNGGVLSAVNSGVCKNQLGGQLSLTSTVGQILKWQESTNNGSSWTDIATTSSTFTAPAMNQTTQYRVQVQNGICPSTFSNTVTIAVKNTPTITDIPNQEICLGSTKIFGDAFVAGTTYSLTSNLGFSSTLNQSSITFNSAGTQFFTYKVTNSTSGCSVEDQFEVTTHPLPEAKVIASTTICESGAIDLGFGSVSGNTYSWSSNPAGFSSTSSNPSVSPTATTQYTLEEKNTAMGCIKTNSVTITIQPKPIVSIANGPDISICESTVNKPIIASISNSYASFNWEVIPSDGGTLTNANTLNPQFTPSLSGIANGSVIVRLNVTGLDPCNTIVSKEVKFTIDKTTVSLGSDQLVCEGLFTIPATVTNAGSISWTHNGNGFILFFTSFTTNPIYVPSALDRDKLVTFNAVVTPKNGCGANATDSVIYQINGAPSVNAGSNTTVCETQLSHTLNASTSFTDSLQWTHDGSGTLDNPSTEDPTYTISPSDITKGSVTFTLRGKKTGCNDVTSTVTLTLRKNPIANAGTAQTICQGQTVFFTGTAPNADSVNWTKSTGGGVLNNANSLTPNYVSSASDSGTITFTLVAQPDAPFCNTPSVATTTVTIIPKPTASIGIVNPQICEGNTYTVSTATALNYDSLVWSASNTGGSFIGGTTLTPTYIPGPNDINSGSVKLTLTAKKITPCIEDAIAEFTLIINKIPKVTVVTADQDVCTDAGVAVPILGAAANFGVVATDFDALTWTTSGSGTFVTPNPTTTSTSNSYIPSAADIANGSVNLTLTATRTPINCNASKSNTITLHFIKKPLANAGSDSSICENATYTSTSASASNFSTIVWSSNGSAGTISNPNSLNGMVYTPSAVDIANGSVSLTLTAVGNLCQNPVTDNVIITFEKLPVISTIASASICKSANQFAIGGTSITNNFVSSSVRWTTTGTGTFTTTSDLKNPIYIPSNADKASGSVTLSVFAKPVAPCVTEQSKSFVLTFIPEPVASAGPSLTKCDLPFSISTSTATMTTISGLKWTTSGTGIFDVDNALNPIYTPSVADVNNGSVSLKLTANPISPCVVANESTVVVTLVKSPKVSVVSPQSTICENETNVLVTGSSVLNASSINWTSTTGTTISNASSVSPIVTPSATDITNGFIELTLTVSPLIPCSGDFTETVKIPIQQKPKVDAGVAQTICEGNVLTTSDAVTNNVTNIQWTNNGGDGTFTTSATTRVTEYTPGPNEIASGSVLLTLTADAIAPCLGTVSSTIQHFITKNPVISINPTEVSICENQTYKVPLSQVNVVNPTSVGSVKWTTTNSASLSGSTTFSPTYTPTPADIAAGFATLTLTVTPISPCALPIVKTLKVNINKKASIDATQTHYSFCENTQKQLTATFANHDSTSIQWRVVSGGGTLSGSNTATPIYTPDSSSSTVIIEVAAASILPCSLTTTQQFVLNVIKKPVVSLPKLVDTICNSQTSYALNGNTVTPATAATTYLWTSTGTGNFSDNTALQTNYIFSATDLASSGVSLKLKAVSDNLCALTDSKEIQITIKPAPTATTVASESLCEDNVFTATALASNETSVLWSTVSPSNGIFANANAKTATYTPGSNDTNSFTIRFTAIGDPVCAVASVTKQVTIQKKPTLDAGIESRHSCASEPFTITGVTTQNIGTLSWSSSSSSGTNLGTFSNPSIANPIYTPSAAEIAAGSPITLTVTATAISPCTNSVSDFIILNLDPKQIVNAGVDQKICEGSIVNLTGSVSNTSSVRWTSSGTGSFANDNQASTTYQPSSADILNGSVTLTLRGISDSNCSDVTDSLVITIVKKPTANAGNAVSICEGTSYTLVNGEASASNYASLTWTATGPGILDPSSSNGLNPTYNPAPGQKGDVVLTLTANGVSECAVNVTSKKTITIVPKPIVTTPNTRTICQGQNLQLDATEVAASDFSSLSWTSSNGLGSFAPSTTQATTYLPEATQSGAVKLRLTATALNPVCANEFAEVSVNIIPTPIVNAGLDASICQTATHQISGASVPSGATFEWSISGPATIQSGTETTLTPLVVPNTGASGSVILTLTVQGTTQCPTTVSDTVTITVFPKPTVDAGLPLTACEGISSVSLNGTASNGANYTWTTDGSGTIQTTTNPLQAKYVPSASDYLDPSGKTTVSFFLTASGTNGCTSVVDSTTLTLFAQPQVFAGIDQIACQSSTISIPTATASKFSAISWTSSGNGSFDFTSSNGGINPKYILGSSDTNTVTLTVSAMPNAQCNQVAVTDQMVITVNKNPSIQTSATEVTMCGESFTLPDLITVANASSITWTNTTGLATVGTITNTNSETPLVTPTADEIANGFVTLKVTAQPLTGCSATATQNIKVNLKEKVSANAGTDVVVCQGQTIVLNNSAATTATTYLWTEDGAGTIKPSTASTLYPEYLPTASEKGVVILTLNAKNPSPCLGEVTDTMSITINPLPTVSVGSDATICATSSYNLVNTVAENYDNQSSNLEWFAYQDANETTLSTGTFNDIHALNPTFTPSATDVAAGKVYLKLQVTSTSCSTVVSDKMELTIAPGIGVNAGVNTTICEGSSFTLSQAVAANSASISWISAQNSNGTSLSGYQAGSFSNANSLQPTYTPSADDITKGFVFLKITGQSNSTCPSNSSVVRLDITKQPKVTVSDVQLCVSTPQIILSGIASDYQSLNWSVQSGPGSIVNNSGAPLNPTYVSGLSPTDTTNRTAIVRLLANPKSGCPSSKAVFKDITISIQGLPAVEAGLNGSTCFISGQPIAPFSITGTTVTNGGNQNWTSSASGTFSTGNPVAYNSFSNSCTDEVLTLTVNGLGACSSATNSDTVNLAINCAVANLGSISSSATSTICQSETATITYTVPVNSIVGKYVWSVPSGAIIVSGQDTNTIAVRFGIGSVSGNVSVFGSNGCGNGSISTFSVTVNALPTATSISGQQTVCAGSSGVVYTATAIPTATSYSWTLVDGTNVSTLSNTLTVNYQMTDVSRNIVVKANNSCGSGPISSNYPITLIEKPALSSTLTPTAVCSESIFEYVPQATISGTSFSWTRAVQSGITNPSASANGNVNEILTNTTSNPISVVYQYTLTGPVPGSCTSQATVTVSVKPIPSLTSSTAPVAICSGTTFNYTPTSATAGTINWSRATVSGISESASTGSSTINEVLTNTTALPITVIYKIELPTNIFGCNKIIDFPVVVNPIPTAAINGNVAVCKNDASPLITFTGSNGTPPYTFTYTINGGANQSLVTTTGNSATISALTNTVGTTNYTLVSVKDASSSACSQLQSGTATVVVNPIPVLVVNAPAAVCSPQTVDITATTAGSDTGLTFTYWKDAQATIPLTNPTTATAGTYFIKATTSFGCFDIKSVTVIVNPLPSATIDGSIAVCKDSASPTLTFTGNGGTPPYTFEYSINGGAVQTISTLTGNSATLLASTVLAGVFEYKILSVTDSSSSACSQVQTGSAVITVNPLPQATITGTTLVCNNATNPVVTFTGSNGIAPYTFTYTINGGVKQTITSTNDTVTLTVPTTTVGLFTYDLVSVKDSSSTACSQLQSGSAVITVNPLPNLVITNPATVCLPNTVDITNTTSGSSVGLIYSYWNDNATTVALTNPASIAISGTYFIKGTDANNCANVKPVLVKINPLPQATITGLINYTVCQNEAQPQITFKGSNATAPYVFHYRINSGAVQTVATPIGSDSVSIAIPTSTVGNFIVTLLEVQDSSTASCSNTVITSPSQAFINVQQGGTILPQNLSAVSQIVCQKSAMIPAIFAIDGSATNAYVTNLPAGVNGTYNSVTKTLTISGSPIATGVFAYVIHTSGSVNGCDSTYSGTLTVNANDTITVVTPTVVNQKVCECTSITPISFSLGGGATGGDVVFSPNAPTGLIWSIASNVLTISGTSCEVGSYSYKVRSFGICDQTTFSGTIDINTNATVSLVSGNPTTTLCVGSTLATPIKFGISPSSSGMILKGSLPTGMTFTPSTGLISGTPTQSGVFAYTITSSSNCGQSISGTITVNAVQSISLLSGNTQQLACINSPIDPILFTVGAGVTSVSINPALPAGLSAVLDSSTAVLTIAGSPTVATSLPQNYTITTQGGCGLAATTSISLDIKPVATITFLGNSASTNQAVCLNSPIVPIQFKIGGGATGIITPSLPNGLSLSFDASTATYTIQGSPTVNGTFTIPITTTGCTTTQNIIVTNVNTVVSISLNSAQGTDNQKICQTTINLPITPISYKVVGATSVNVTGLPLGVTATFSSATGELLISGTPTEPGIFNYTITSVPCSFVKTGVMKISTPIFITNEKVTDVSCGSTDNGSISVTLIGGVTTNGQYAIQWTSSNGYQNNLATITGLAPGDYSFAGSDAIGCLLPKKTFTVLPAASINISLLSTSNVSCNGKLGCANFNYTGGSGIYTQFKLQYLDPSSQSLNTIIASNNNYFNICNLKAGVYYLTVTDSNNCSTEPYLFTIYDYSTLKIDEVSLDANLCTNSAGKVRVTMSSLDTSLVFYYNNTIVPFVALGNNVYELSIANPTTPSGIIKVINDQNCWDTETITTAITDPKFEYTSLNLNNFGSISVNESVKFTNGLTASNIPTEYDYLVWDFGDSSPFKVFYNPADKNPNSNGESFTTVFHTYAVDGLYPVTLTIFNKFGCSRTITKIVTVGQGAGIMLPTAFTPNNDGINDLFRPSLLGLKEISMFIYDNWGNLVYEITSDTASLPADWGWNGVEKVNNEPVNGTYRCYIQAKTINNKIVEKEGQFILIK